MVGLITPDIISGFFRISEIAAMGSPQLAAGPQKFVPVHGKSDVGVCVQVRTIDEDKGSSNQSE